MNKYSGVERVPKPLSVPKDSEPAICLLSPDEDPGERSARLAVIARHIRRSILTTIGAAKIGHVGGDLSVTDILTTLFFSVLRYHPDDPSWPQRDRFILSKGHCAVGLYSTLACAGFIPESLLPSFAGPLSPLNGHPNRRKVPGVESNTGPLGHGLPVGVGCAMAAKLARADWHTFVVLGDGELQEGSNWEAAMAAAHGRLANLTAIVDRNGLQQGAKTEETNALEPLADKWKSFGWNVVEVDGHDYGALYTAFAARGGTQPRCVIAHTHKGRGVSFMEDGVAWHHKVPSPEQVEAALAEIGQ
jgi:transketolase